MMTWEAIIDYIKEKPIGGAIFYNTDFQNPMDDGGVLRIIDGEWAWESECIDNLGDISFCYTPINGTPMDIFAKILIHLDCADPNLIQLQKFDEDIFSHWVDYYGL